MNENDVVVPIAVAFCVFVYGCTITMCHSDNTRLAIAQRAMDKGYVYRFGNWCDQASADKMDSKKP